MGPPRILSPSLHFIRYYHISTKHALSKLEVEALAKKLGGLKEMKQEIKWLSENIKIKNSSEKELILLRQLRERLYQHKPLQYILKTQPFGSLEISVEPPTLIPRWETEEWCIKLSEMLKTSILAHSRNTFTILDLCTGTGCIGLLLTHLLRSSILQHGRSQPKIHAILVDKQAHAISLCQRNVAKYLEDTSQKTNNNVEFTILQGDVSSETFWSVELQRLIESVDVVTSNPPYILENDYQGLEQSVRDWEDREALVGGGPRGCDIHEAILKNVPKIMALSAGSGFSHSSDEMKTPCLAFEVGNRGQATFLQEQMRQVGLMKVGIWNDLAKNARTYWVWSFETTVADCEKRKKWTPKKVMLLVVSPLSFE